MSSSEDQTKTSVRHHETAVSTHENVVSLPRKKRKKAPKTESERQAKSYSKKTLDGWKRVWIDPPTYAAIKAHRDGVEGWTRQREGDQAELEALRWKVYDFEAEVSDLKRAAAAYERDAADHDRVASELAEAREEVTSLKRDLSQQERLLSEARAEIAQLQARTLLDFILRRKRY